MKNFRKNNFIGGGGREMGVKFRERLWTFLIDLKYIVISDLSQKFEFL